MTPSKVVHKGNGGETRTARLCGRDAGEIREKKLLKGGEA